MEQKLYKSEWTFNKTPLHINNKMTGKMVDVPGCSTSRRPNPFCEKCAKNPEFVCAHCYVEDSFNHFPNLARAMEDNFNLLTTRELTDEELPIFKNTAEFVRIEAFGEIANEQQAANYLKIIYANPNMPFGWWSKRIDIIDKVIAVYGKPKNMNLLQSSFMTNVPAKVTSKYVDHRFTVYEKEYAIEHGIAINCGAKGCRYECGGLCYHKKFNDIFDINELLRPRKGGKKA